MRRRQHLASIVLVAVVLGAGSASARNGNAMGQQPPASTAVPTISGTPMVRSTLSASTGSWSGVSITYGYQWARCDAAGAACAPLAGEVASAHAVTNADVGSTLRTIVTATNKNGAAIATSDATGIIATPTTTPPPTTTTTTTTSTTTTSTSTTTTPTSSSCTLYASPSGLSTNSGSSPTSPLTLAAAAGRTVPGDVVCLLAGTYPIPSVFYITRSGTQGSPISYKSYDGNALLKWTGSGSDDMIQAVSNSHDLVFSDLTFDGDTLGNNAVHCKDGSYRIQFLRNTVQNTGSMGFAGTACDYVTVDHNRFFHIGYGTGWSSAVSFNSFVWSNTAAGFHSYVTNNIISGTSDESTYHSDGNGIIMDRGGNVPSVLIANNLVYENGGRCIHDYHVQNIWVVNNTCYKNGLDDRLGATGEFTNYDAQNIHLINNIAVAWTGRYPYKVEAGSVVSFSRNSAWEGLTSIVPSSVLSDPTQLRATQPGFLDAPSVDATQDQQQRQALAPWLAGTRFTLIAGAPLIDAGIDSGYVFADLVGTPRPQGSGFDFGAFER